MKRQRDPKPRKCRQCIFGYYRDGKLVCMFGKSVVSRKPCKDFTEIEP